MAELILIITVAACFFLAGIMLTMSNIEKFRTDVRFPIERSAGLATGFFLLGAVCCLGVGIKLGKRDFQNMFVQEIMLEQASVKGRSSFVVATKVIFQDAELSGVVPIEGSAKPME